MLIGIISKVGIQKSLSLSTDLEKLFSKDHEIWLSDVDDIDKHVTNFIKTDLLLTLGGDGTILRVAR